MNINSTPKQVPTNFNGMLKIKHPTRVTNMVKGLEVAENASETLIDPSRIESFIQCISGNRITITTPNYCYEIFTEIKHNTLEKLNKTYTETLYGGINDEIIEFNNGIEKTS